MQTRQPHMQGPDISDLMERLIPSGQIETRFMLGVVGPPGSGKSTVSEALAKACAQIGLRAAVVPMDGFHYDNAVLTERGQLPRKGAPETFDVAGLSSLLARLRRNDEPDIAIPVFDRSLEIARNAGRIIPQETQILIVEGNYLLLDRPGWRDLARLFDRTVALHVDEAELRRRLVQRWQDHNIPEADIITRVEENDLPNGRAVMSGSLTADITLRHGT